MNQRAARRLGALVVSAAALLLVSGAFAGGKKPRAVFKETAHDFGKVKQGDVVSHEFVFKNGGEATLVVDRVETTCGCTAALASEQKIPPGKEGKIKTTFDTRGYSGRMTRYVYLVAGNAENERTELSLTVDIEVPPSARIDIGNYNIDMGLCLEGEAPSAKIVIRSVGERELKVELAHENIKFVSGGRPLASPFFLPAGESREVELRFPPQSRPGLQRDYVLIKSNDPVRSTFSVYVSRYIVTKKELKELFDKYGPVLKDRD
jgi:hypothetical protein